MNGHEPDAGQDRPVRRAAERQSRGNRRTAGFINVVVDAETDRHGRISCARCTSSGRWYKKVHGIVRDQGGQGRVWRYVRGTPKADLISSPDTWASPSPAPRGRVTWLVLDVCQQ